MLVDEGARIGSKGLARCRRRLPGKDMGCKSLCLARRDARAEGMARDQSGNVALRVANHQERPAGRCDAVELARQNQAFKAWRKRGPVHVGHAQRQAKALARLVGAGGDIAEVAGLRLCFQPVAQMAPPR